MNSYTVIKRTVLTRRDENGRPYLYSIQDKTGREVTTTLDPLMAQQFYNDLNDGREVGDLTTLRAGGGEGVRNEAGA
jgi:hypothetical protein